MKNKTPDTNQQIMRDNFGTVVLITDPRADKYLQRAKRKTNEPPANRMTRPCGGRGGFDDYVERWHE